MILKQTYPLINGVYHISEPSSTFENAYVKVRTKENRLYTNEIVKKLPYIHKNHPQVKEWKMRQKSLNRFINYLSHHPFNTLLEIGCGNGWFIHHCSKHVQTSFGIDINLQELEQGAALFKTQNLSFLYGDIFASNPFSKAIDIIVLNASVQYFEDLNQLFNQLKQWLRPGGEIHILDSPFYHPNQLHAAKERSANYYASQGAEAMIPYYHHHSKSAISNFEQLYVPAQNKWIQKFRPDMPYGWYKWKS